MSLLDELSELVAAAFADAGLDPTFGEVVVSQRPELSQFQCNGALAVAKQAGRSPRDIAEQIAAAIATDDRVSQVEVAGPGFINLSVTDEHLGQWLERTNADARLGVNQTAHARTVIIDYGGPNVAKDLHVGHLRTALIGESLKRVYALVGHDVKGDVHLGDWGLPMGQLIAALEEDEPTLPYFDADRTDGFPTDSPVTVDDLQVLYPQASAKSKADPAFAEKARAATVALQEGRPGYRALWEHFRTVSVEALRETYDRLGVHFELWLGEASVADRLDSIVEQLRSSGVAVESDGALVVRVERDDDQVEVPPLMVLNSRGGATYAATDLATLVERVDDFGADEIVYIVDLRQSLHFTQVFRAAQLAGIAGPDVSLTHSGNGTVNGPDGKPFKTRDGDLPRLSDMVRQVIDLAGQRLDENDLATDVADDERAEIARVVGLGALKFGELSNHRATNYSFDLERFTQMQGRTGPYLLYVAVRTSSIMQRVAEHGIEAGTHLAPAQGAEHDLALMLLQWPEVVDRSLAGHSPNTIAEYAYELSGAFNRFYDACHILSETDEAVQRSWVALVALTRRVLVTALDLLVIDVPERM